MGCWRLTSTRRHVGETAAPLSFASAWTSCSARRSSADRTFATTPEGLAARSCSSTCFVPGMRFQVSVFSSQVAVSSPYQDAGAVTLKWVAAQG